MITLTEKKLKIEIGHPCPEDYLHDLRDGLFQLLENIDGKAFTGEELKELTAPLLVLLRAIQSAE